MTEKNNEEQSPDKNEKTSTDKVDSSSKENFKKSEKADKEADEASLATLEELTDNPIDVGDGLDHPNLSTILEIPVSMTMEVGSTNISIRNLLKLSQGSVIELDRYAGDPLDVFVNGTLIAHGEVVVVNEKFGIRLTDVISQAERIMKLGDI